MILSKQDMFCEKKTTSTTKAYTDVLDFHNHGDDILNKLFWFVLATTAAADASLTVAWETSPDETFTDSSGSSSATTLWTKTFTASELVAGEYIVSNEALPKGLKRYNRLSLQCTNGTDSSVTTKVYPNITAALIDGRNEGTPFVGLG